jgi:endonuclease/exonuclease/phosphatase family metal-dependent hydrolase
MAIVIATYNVLASAYLKPEWYPFSEPERLVDATRLPALADHLAELGADLWCLQEVDRAGFALVRDRLASLGYVGEVAWKGQGRPDGCAVFVNPRSVVLHDAIRVEYQDGVDGQPPSGHIAQIAIVGLEGRRLGVANTHLKWDPPSQPEGRRYGDRQIAELLGSRERVAPDCDGWLVCGDLNVTGDSEVVRTLIRAGFRPTHDPSQGGATSNANQRAKMIDYLFYGPGLVAEPLPLPMIDDRMPLPGPGQPSDHVAVMARLAWGG